MKRPQRPHKHRWIVLKISDGKKWIHKEKKCIICGQYKRK